MARSNVGNGNSYLELETGVLSETETGITFRTHVYLTSNNVIDSTNRFFVFANYDNTYKRDGVAGLNGAHSRTLMWYYDHGPHVKTYDGPRTYGHEANFSGVEYWGTTLQVVENFTVPARTPKAPNTPSAPSIGSVTSSGFTVSWSAPGTNGSAISGWTLEIRTSGGSLVKTYNPGASARSQAVTGLSPYTAYKARILAKSGAGSSAYSGYSGNVTTDYNAPSAPAAPKISSITSTGATAAWSAPSSNGGKALTGYDIEWSTTGGTVLETQAVTGTSDAAPKLTPNTAYRARVRAKNGKTSSWSAYSSSFTTAVAAPSAPTNQAVSRTSDTSQSLTWTRNAPSTAPYASQEILRRVATGDAWSAWSVIATVSATATSYTDTSTTAGNVYQYQIRAKNASGTATSGTTKFVFTTPDAVSNVVAEKTATSIVVTWTVPAALSGRMRYEIQESTNGGSSWANLSTTLTSGSYTHASPNTAVPHRYRVRSVVAAVSSDPGEGLASGYVNSNEVQLLAAPNAPTNLKASPTGTVDRDQPITLSWQHNPVDSSVQTKSQVQHRLTGSSTWTVMTAVANATKSLTLPGGTYPSGASFEWQVRTWGLHADASPYSATNTVSISSKPSTNITSPLENEVLKAATLAVEWNMYDADGNPQAAWEAALLNASGTTVLEQKSGLNADTATTFATRVQDQTAYQIRVRTRDSAGLWSDFDTVPITVAYALPPKAEILSSFWDWKQATVELQISVPAPGENEAPVHHLEIWRSIDGGPLEQIADGLDPTTDSFLDWTPTVQGTNTYVVQTVSDIPSGQQSDTQVVARRNVAPQPYSTATSGPMSAASAASWGGTSPTISSVEDSSAPSGRGYVRRFTAVVASPSTYADMIYATTPNRVPIVVGEPVTLSIWLRPSAQIALQPQAQFLTASGIGAGTVNRNPPTVSIPANEWTRVDITATATDPGAVSVRFDIDAPAGTTWEVGFTLDVDALLIEYGETLGDYFDSLSEGARLAPDGTSEMLAPYPPANVTTPGAEDERQSLWLSGGPGMSVRGRLTWEVAVAARRLRDRVLRRYAGRRAPVEHSGDVVDEGWDITGELHLIHSRDKDDPTQPEAWLALGEQPGPHLLRAPAIFGGKPLYEWVSITGPNVSRAAGGNVVTVTVGATAMGR